MLQTFAQLKTELLLELFPIGVPDNLTTSVHAYFVDAVIDLQRWIPCLQVNNTDVVSSCNTYFDCGLTVADVPKGRVKRVSTIANDDWCDRVYYSQTEHARLVEDAKVLVHTAPPAQPSLPPLPPGVLYAGSESDDTVQGRARRGDYAIFRHRLYLLPWLQSNEKLVIEWEGIKRTWSDSDMVDYDPDLKLALKHFVRMSYARDFKADMPEFQVYTGMYNNQRADLMYECREETRTRDAEVTEKFLPTTEQITDDVP